MSHPSEGAKSAIQEEEKGNAALRICLAGQLDSKCGHLSNGLLVEGLCALRQVAARQWFVIRKGWVTVSRDGAIVPHCEMGVEAT
eukprot:4298760-Amphidinium_carterae.1